LLQQWPLASHAIPRKYAFAWLEATQTTVFSGLVIVIAVSVMCCGLPASLPVAGDQQYRAWRDPELEELVGCILW